MLHISAPFYSISAILFNLCRGYVSDLGSPWTYSAHQANLLPTLRTETIIRHVILPRAFRPASLLRFLPLRPHRPSLSSPSTRTAAQLLPPTPPNAPSTALFHLESDLLSPFSLPLHRRKFGPRTPRTVIDSCLENPLPATAEQKFPMYMTDRGLGRAAFFGVTSGVQKFSVLHCDGGDLGGLLYCCFTCAASFERGNSTRGSLSTGGEREGGGG